MRKLWYILLGAAITILAELLAALAFLWWLDAPGELPGWMK
jgi:hypothetical protein